MGLPSNKEMAAILWDGARWAYRKVICMDLCPSSSRTAAMSAPDITSRLANVCRRSWNRKSRKGMFLRGSLGGTLASI
jgi:hypothetical protein